MVAQVEWHRRAASWLLAPLLLAFIALPAGTQTVQREQPAVPDAIVKAGDFAAGYTLVRQQLERCLRTAQSPVQCLDLLSAAINLSLRVDRADEGEVLAGRALSISTQAYGPRSVDAGLAHGALARALGAQNKLATALAAAREAAVLLGALVGIDDPRAISAQDELADAAWATGRIDEAAKAYKQAIEASQRHMLRVTPAEWAPQRPAFARRYNGYATFLREIGEPAAAVDFAGEAMRIWIATLGPDHPITAVGYSTYGLVLADLRRFDEALRYLEQSLRIRRTTSASISSILTAYNNLALTLHDSGNSARASVLLREAVVLIERERPSDLLLVATIRGNLGRYLADQGVYADAAAQYVAARDIRLRIQGEDHPDTAQIGGQLAPMWVRLGRSTEAEQLYRHAAAQALRVFGAAHDRTIRARANYAHFNLRRGQLAVALALYRQSGKAVVERLSTPTFSGSYAEEIRLYNDSFTGHVETAWRLGHR